MRLKSSYRRLQGTSKKKLVGRKLKDFCYDCGSATIVLTKLPSIIQDYWRQLLLGRGYENYLPPGVSRGGSTSGRMGLVLAKIKNVRAVILILAALYVFLVIMAIAVAASISRDCPRELVIPAALIAATAAVRLVWMVGSGAAQAATAWTMLGQQTDSPVANSALRHERRMRYKRWLWWSRFGILVTVMQMLGAAYLIFIIIKNAAYGHKSSNCYPGQDGHNGNWKQIVIIALAIVAWVLAIAQCCAGSDVLAWRSFYATHDAAWRAHYREMFDHGIREVLCCLGRGQYLSVLEEDEVDSVAGLLGDLVAYRAAGAGHLEFLAGVALLQRHGPSLPPLDQFTEAPEVQIQEAVVLHQFAEAAYTGPLLDVGRNPITFPCAWLYRQGVLTPWSRSRWPILQGDNWWRGHAAAFLKYVKLLPDALRKGRVQQARRESAYFVVVAHHLRCVIVAIRGTETPEDLLTDGLCRECALSKIDLDGLLNCSLLDENVKQCVVTSFPHFGHSGIVEAARELCVQLDGKSEDEDKKVSDQSFGEDELAKGSEGASYNQKRGFLSSLLGPGGECHGYALRFVGHSLGGAIGALAGIMLYSRFPNLHVYAYGVLPCVDAVVAEACTSFVTSIIYNDEFSARLSVTSVLRLRAAALAALAADSSTDSAMISKLTRRLLHANKCLRGKTSEEISVQASRSASKISREKKQRHRQRRHKYKIKGNGSGERVSFEECTVLINNSNTEKQGSSDEDASIKEDFDTNELHVHPSGETIVENAISVDLTSHLAGRNPGIDVADTEPVEMFVPGLVIHIVPEVKQNISSSWRNWKWFHGGKQHHRAILRHRESFKDIVVSPSMFLDHMPWRCQYAMQKVLETWNSKGHANNDFLDASHLV